MKNYLILGFLFLSACATEQRTLIENGNLKKPEWVESSKISWTEGDQVYFRSQYTIRSDERLNGCFQLAKLETKESLLREISEDLRGQIDSAQQGISESTELILSQVRSSEYSGKVTGMKFIEQYHERYVSSGVERSDCYILAGIRKTDYDQIKRRVLYKIVEADPDLKRAIKDRAVQFFGGNQGSGSTEAATSIQPATVRTVSQESSVGNASKTTTQDRRSSSDRSEDQE